jgi:SAM-dependent methyltransferase
MFHALTDRLMAPPALYHYLRHAMLGGIPFGSYVRRYGLADPSERVADVGCGPADILRYLAPGRRPAFYLGLDVSPAYLAAARRRAARARLPAEFLAVDLHRLPEDASVRATVRGLLDRHRITTVLLLGVVHHICDAAARVTLDLIHSAPTVRKLITWDAVYLPVGGLGARVNNFLAAQDRGRHVRDEGGYDALAAGSRWEHYSKFWSSPGLSAVRWIHYVFTKAAPRLDAAAGPSGAPRHG